MNFGRLLELICLKINVGFITQSGVLKCLGLLELTILHDDNQEFTPIIKYEELIVYTCCYDNDKTALKSAVEYDNTFKTNVGVTVTFDLGFIKEDDSWDSKMLKTLIVTEAAVGSIATADKKLSLPVSVEYVPKVGRSAENLPSIFTKHVKILQMCDSCTSKTKV